MHYNTIPLDVGPSRKDRWKMEKGRGRGEEKIRKEEKKITARKGLEEGEREREREGGAREGGGGRKGGEEERKK